MRTSTAPRGAISSFAPPMFRGKKPRLDQDPQNKNGMTGPPVQMGKGPGMFAADGRGQAQGIPPRTPNYPQSGTMRPRGQAQGAAPASPNYPQPANRGVRGQAQGLRPRMMADGGYGSDGGFGKVSPIGGMPNDGADMAPQMDDQQQDAGAQSGLPPIIKPEAVNYHDEDQDCKGCAHLQGSQCQVLQMQVSPEGGCNAWESNGQMMDEGSEPDSDDMGGGYPQQ